MLVDSVFRVERGDREGRRREFEAAVRLAEAVPGWRWAVPRGRLPGLGTALEAVAGRCEPRLRSARGNVSPVSLTP